MKKLMTLLVASIGFTFFTLAGTTTKSTMVLFNTDKFELTEQATKTLRKFIKNNLKEQDYLITIKGHTDNVGSINYNKTLSENRAKAVKAYLIGLGLNDMQIEIGYKGELNPRKPNNTDANRQQNRRVEINLKLRHYEDLSELEEAIGTKNNSVHIVSPLQDNLIEGHHGVKVLLKEASFIDEKGNPITENVKIELVEALDYADFISEGLSTKSGDKLLESGGMLKLDATTVSGKQVTVDPRKPMLVAVPTAIRKNDMQIFSSLTGEDWSATNRRINNQIKIKIGKRPEWKDFTTGVESYEVRKPNEPRKPSLPRKPHEPKVESYIRPIPWYRFNKEKIRAFQEKEYNKALELYEKREAKYEQRIARYQGIINQYEQQKEQYKLLKEEWDLCMAEWGVNDCNGNKYWELYAEYRKKKINHQIIQEVDYYQIDKQAYRESLSEWQEKKRAALLEAGKEMDKLGIASTEIMNHYVFEYNQLNWINCDRYKNLPEKEKQIIVLKGKPSVQERVLILFRDSKSMIAMDYDGKEEAYVRKDMPKQESMVIFAYKVSKGRPMLCFQEVNGSSAYAINYKLTSLAEIKSIIESFSEYKTSS